MLSPDPVLRRSAHLSAFAHRGDVYLYHDLYGYIMQMSPDVLGFLDAFAAPASVAEVCSRYQDVFSGQSPEEFVAIFAQFACLLPPDEDELAGVWPMVAVKSRWNVWKRQDDGSLALYTAWGQRPPARHVLGPAETRIWDAIDGEVRLDELRKRHDPALVASLVKRLVHHDVQALKLSAFPLSTYGGRKSLRPPYLTSTMPYAPYRPGAAPEAQGADADLEHQETTLSHLLREPHPVLGGRSYGQALVDALAGRGCLPERGDVRVLELGAGLGHVAGHVIERLRARELGVSYDIVEPSAALAAAQRQRLGALATVRDGGFLDAPLPEAGYDLILCDEMIGGLPAVELTRAQAGLDAEPGSAERQAAQDALGEVGRVIAAHGLELDDAPEPFHLAVGALSLLERLWPALAPGGTCVITAFGELSIYPRLSTQLERPELSMHFGHLVRAAEQLGFEVAYEYVIDLLDFDRSLEGLATTRSYFRALAMLLGEHGVELPRLGYTRSMLEQLMDGKVAPGSVGDLYFERIEDRLMGLTPHELKALILRRPHLQ